MLPFDDLGDDVPPLLVVGRETALATGYADVVAVDRDELVTVIETKLGRNPEVKRTVVAQVLSYAASLWGLSYDDFDRDVAQRYFSGGQCPEPDLNGLALDEAMARFVEARALGGDWDRSGFREQLGANLRAGRFRLVIVVDRVNDELRQIVEFLNACTGPSFQILCAELRYFATPSARLLVPALIGVPPKASPAPARTGKRWDAPRFLAEIETRHGSAERAVVERLLTWADQHCDWIYWGEGQSGGFSARIRIRSEVGPALFVVYTYGSIEVGFQYLKTYPPYDDPDLRQALLAELNTLPGIALRPDAFSKRPSFPLSALLATETQRGFLTAMEGVVGRLRAKSSP